MPIARRTLAIVVAFAAVVVLSIGSDIAIDKTLAPDHRIEHALILGFVGLAFGSVGMIFVHEPGSTWYPIAVAAQALPFAWIGGQLATRR